MCHDFPVGNPLRISIGFPLDFLAGKLKNTGSDNRRHLFPITNGFSNMRHWDFATLQHILFCTSLSTMILFTTLFHTSRGFVLHDPYSSITSSTKVFYVKYEISILHLPYQISFITNDYDTLIFLQHLIGKNIGLQYSHCNSVRKSHHINVMIH